MSGVAFVPIFLLGGFFPVIRQDLDVSSAFLGLTISAFYLASTVGYSIAGAVVDRWPAHLSLRIGALTIAVAVAQLGWPGAPAWTLVAAMSVTGVGHSFVQTSGNAWLAHGASRPAFGFGAKQSSAAAAGMVAGSVVASVPAERWRLAFLAAAGVIALGAALIRPAQHRTPGREQPTGPPRLRTMWPVALAALLGAAVALTAAAYFSESMVRQDFSVSSAGKVMFLSALLCVTGRLAIGYGLDHVPRMAKSACAAAWVCAAVGFVMLAARGAPASLTVLGTVLAYGVGWSWTGALLFAVAHENPDHPARVTATIQSAASIGGMFGPLIGGVVVGRTGFTSLWLGCGVLAVLAAGAVLMRTGRSPVTSLATPDPH